MTPIRPLDDQEPGRNKDEQHRVEAHPPIAGGSPVSPGPIPYHLGAPTPIRGGGPVPAASSGLGAYPGYPPAAQQQQQQQYAGAVASSSSFGPAAQQTGPTPQPYPVPAYVMGGATWVQTAPGRTLESEPFGNGNGNGHRWHGQFGAPPLRLQRHNWRGEDTGAASQPLRVIHVGPCLARGGAEVWLIDFLRFVDPRRVRVLRTIATMPDRVDPSFVADLPLPVEVGGADCVRRAATECDVLLCWGIELDDWLADCRPPLCVYVAHGDGPWTRMLLERSRRTVDHVVAVSQRVRDRACGDLPSTVIYNGIDTGRLGRTAAREEVRRRFGFGPDDFVLGYVGRFSAEKRVHAIIDAVAGLPERFKALLVGWGPDYPALIELANRRIPGRHAFVSDSQYLGDYYQAMDAFCLVGAEEGFSLAMLEAMMCERPLIATPVGAVPELVEDRVTGLVVNGSPETIRQAAERLQRHPHWARGLAGEARAFAERHGHALRMARDYEDLFESLWNRRACRVNGSSAHAAAALA